MPTTVTPEQVIDFWFVEHGSDDWFAGSEEFDRKIDEKFRETRDAAAKSELFGWRTSPKGRLAEIIVLDQFSRQLYRGEAEAFAADPLCLALAQELVLRGEDKSLTDDERHFAYMPFMHSESMLVHQEAVRLYTELGNEDGLKFEMMHFDIIKRFGRYPMRNKPLGRPSTPEEAAYIEERQGKMF
ncbi:DUF924 family protein [Cucumibacter marinus]|uniref:DUF924 family protein n=1 Tax=Cucumibacter marinus TaxID=1121252 RepID=UPI0004161F25|nr:DUF924 family protein [Cucumibacter marinus]